MKVQQFNNDGTRRCNDRLQLRVWQRVSLLLCCCARYHDLSETSYTHSTMKVECYISEAQARAKRRKSKWNLLLILLGFISIAVIWFLLAKLIPIVHKIYYPSHHFGQSKNNLSGILMFVPIIFPSISIGLMLSDCIIWCIPPARKMLDMEAKGTKAGFRKSMRSLAVFTAVLLPVALLLGFMGAINLF